MGTASCGSLPVSARPDLGGALDGGPGLEIGAGTAMRCAVFLLLRNDIPHRGLLLEDPSVRLARECLFCTGSTRCSGRAAPMVNILAWIINPRRPVKRHLK